MPIDLQEKTSEGIDWQRYLGFVRRHTWHLLVPFFLGWLAVWIASWFMPSVYRSNTLIIVEEPTVPAQFVVPNVAGDLQDRLQSITQQILSRTRLLHIIDQFTLYAKYRERSSPDDLVDRMRKDIEIELVRSEDRRELTAFNVYYSADNPQTAQAVTAELTTLFIRQNLEVRQQQSETTTKFLESQLVSARENLAEQEAKVRDFKDKYLGQLPGQLQTNLQILGGLQNQLQTEEDALGRAKQQNTYLQSLLTQYHSLQGSAKNGDDTPVGLPAVDKELGRLKGQLADLSSHYTERHPDVRKLKEEIAKTEKLKRQIVADLNKPHPDDATANPSSDAPGDYGDLRDGSPMFQVQSQLKANSVEIANHQGTIQEVQAKIAEYQARLGQEPVREQQLADLTRGYEQSKADYDSLLKKKNESELATNLERQQQGEHFQVMDPPSLPVKPYSPNRLKLFAIGLGAGLALGLGLSLALEMMDDRIYTEKGIQKLMPADILVEIPILATVDEQKRDSRGITIRWTGVGVVCAVVLAAFVATYYRG